MASEEETSLLPGKSSYQSAVVVDYPDGVEDPTEVDNFRAKIPYKKPILISLLIGLSALVLLSNHSTNKVQQSNRKTHKVQQSVPLLGYDIDTCENDKFLMEQTAELAEFASFGFGFLARGATLTLKLAYKGTAQLLGHVNQLAGDAASLITCDDGALTRTEIQDMIAASHRHNTNHDIKNLLSAMKNLGFDMSNQYPNYVEMTDPKTAESKLSSLIGKIDNVRDAANDSSLDREGLLTYLEATVMRIPIMLEIASKICLFEDEDAELKQRLALGEINSLSNEITTAIKYANDQKDKFEKGTPKCTCKCTDVEGTWFSRTNYKPELACTNDPEGQPEPGYYWKAKDPWWENDESYICKKCDCGMNGCSDGIRYKDCAASMMGGKVKETCDYHEWKAKSEYANRLTDWWRKPSRLVVVLTQVNDKLSTIDNVDCTTVGDDAEIVDLVKEYEQEKQGGCISQCENCRGQC